MNYRQPYPNELYHYGVLGMKWGVRRYQNSDGSLTAAGRKRYEKVELNRRLKSVDPKMAKNKSTRSVAEDYHNLSDDQFLRKYKTTKNVFKRRYVRYEGDTYSAGKKKAAKAEQTLKTAKIASGVIVGLGLAFSTAYILKNGKDTLDALNTRSFEALVAREETSLLRGRMDEILIKDLFG